MIESQRAEFFRELEVFSGRYPAVRWEPRHRDAFWICLQYFDLADIAKGLAVASAGSPQFMPPAEVVRNAVADIQRKRKTEEDELRRQTAEREEARRYHNPAPTDVNSHQAYIDAGGSAFERLARQWECESTRLGAKPDQPTPQNIGKARLAQFWAVHGNACDGKVIP